MLQSDDVNFTAVGMDIHQKIVIVRDQEPSFTRLHQGKKINYPSREVHIIEDDKDTYQVGVEQVKRSDTEVDYSMYLTVNFLRATLATVGPYYFACD